MRTQIILMVVLLNLGCYMDNGCKLPKENCILGGDASEDEIESKLLGTWKWECFEFDNGPKEARRDGEYIEFLPGQVLVHTRQGDSVRIDTLYWKMADDPLGRMLKTHGGQKRWGNIQVCDEALRFGTLTYDGPNHMFKRIR